MTLQSLRYLIALVDHGHFGRAAQACHISQPTLSTQIKKLEEQLGAALFERTNKVVRVTAFGEEIVARARRIATDVEAVKILSQRGSRPLVGTLRLGVITTLGPYISSWLMLALKTEYPELRLAVDEDFTAHLLDGVLAGRLDAALVSLPLQDDRFEVLPLFDEPFWYARPKMQNSVITGILNASDLLGQRLLLLSEGHCLRDQALAICGEPSAHPNGDFRATSLETIKQMVALGLGCTLLPAMACGDTLTGAIAVHPVDGIERRIGLVWRHTYSKVRDLHLLAQTVCNNLPQGVTAYDRTTQA